MEELSGCRHRRECPSLTDEQWLKLGVCRVLEDQRSGRGFLQHLQAQDLLEAPALSLFFETLKSGRREGLCAEVNTRIARRMARVLPDPLAIVSSLDGFDVYAGDGHYHGAATHDPREEESGTKWAVGHFYTLNLRTHALTHLTGADAVERKREHDMRALKRQEIDTLRQGANKGRKVLYIWDRAGIDFQAWQRWKQTGGIYFLSREKENMVLSPLEMLSYEPEDPINAGVLCDEKVRSSCGVVLRRVTYYDVVRKETFTFITTEMTLEPGVIAHLYKMRWDIEKTFDEIKNKLDEKKAWASSPTAKTMQAIFICLAHNLMILLEHRLETDHGINNQAEINRREQRFQKTAAKLDQQGIPIPWLQIAIQRLTQRSVKFIRWLRCHLFSPAPYCISLDHLRRLYASL